MAAITMTQDDNAGWAQRWFIQRDGAPVGVLVVEQAGGRMGAGPAVLHLTRPVRGVAQVRYRGMRSARRALGVPGAL